MVPRFAPRSFRLPSRQNAATVIGNFAGQIGEPFFTARDEIGAGDPPRQSLELVVILSGGKSFFKSFDQKGLTFAFEVRKKFFHGPGESLYGSELLRSGAAEIEQIFAFERG